jgi:hypothetical protein
MGAGFDFRVLESPPAGRPEEGLDLPPPPAGPEAWLDRRSFR